MMNETLKPYPPHPVILEGKHVLLRPIHSEDENELIGAAKDGTLWNLWYTIVPSPDQMKAYISRAIAEQENKKSLPFAVIRKSDTKIVGTTRYMNIEPELRRMEIGSTWYSTSAQKTSINTECKYLLLKYAFEDLGCVAMEFRTHWINHASRRAIERLGAKQDGVLRSHRLLANGTVRDTVVYSILSHEWDTIKSHLEFKLSQVY